VLYIYDAWVRKMCSSLQSAGRYDFACTGSKPYAEIKCTSVVVVSAARGPSGVLIVLNVFRVLYAARAAMSAV
jgi:hypothetical protein